MGSYYPKEVKFKVTLLILFVLISNIIFLMRDFKFYLIPIVRGGVTQYERRFDGLEEIIRDTNIVGYITDQEMEEMLDDIYSTSRFYLTQYALSPVIVDNSLEHGFVIGNFHRPISNYEDFEDKDLVVLKDFGNGVILFKHRVK